MAFFDDINGDEPKTGYSSNGKNNLEENTGKRSSRQCEGRVYCYDS